MTPAGSLAVAAPPRVRDRLRAAPDGPVPVVHRGQHALYVDVGGWCVGVVAAGAARVPCALRPAAALPESVMRGATSAYLEGGTLHVGNRSLPIGRIEGTYVPRIRHGVVCSTEASPVTVQATPPATVAGLVAAALPDGRIDAHAVPRLVGRGEGLTPLGDDLVCGWLALHRAAGVSTDEVDAAVRTHAARTTLLSATLLDCALHGEVLPEFAAWLRALGTPEAPERARTLGAVGATSGAGMLHGARIALDQLREADPPHEIARSPRFAPSAHDSEGTPA